ncbi:phenylalanine--tRNA ligase subunit beta [Curvivirga sp.]|uniref:phenylalanine--tRNA ligase subunit beta n=1 Tax=Curvivirga sp. TaxID=2856848 RepID=UPI003B5ADCE4
MKFTLSWLKDHLETDASLEEITNKLTAIGLELEGVEDPKEALKPFTICYVEDAWKHPNADKLNICMVNNGTETVQVVCGAPNARKGMKGVFAPSGSFIPGSDMTLKPGVIRGEESNGMLCSERELMISDEHDGIIDLPEDAPLGMSFAEYAGKDDPIIEIAITPNRGDCLGVYGVARDLAAAGLGTLKAPNLDPVEGKFDSPINWNRVDGLGDDAPRAVGCLIKNVKNGPSPKWMQDRLKAIGLRPISALVDITNYVTFDLGRPLHVFDADKVKGDLTIGYAKGGETLLGLDGNEHTFEEGMIVISDENGPESIGGIMGGEVSGCTEETVNVFLESALWHPIRIAETGRKLGVDTDARYRFERGVDPLSSDWGVNVGTRLILDLCGGEPSNVTAAGDMPAWERQTSLRVSRLKTHGGADVSVAEAEEILKRLGFGSSVDGDVITVDIPSWRPDIEGEHCLVEEVLRIYGFDKIPAVALDRETVLPELAISLKQRRVAFAKKILAGRGMMEAITWSFMSDKDAELFGGVPQNLMVANPISSDLNAMRPSILGNLISAAARNTDRGFSDVALFEVGPAFRDPTPKGQDMVAAGVRAGKTGPRHWETSPRAVDLFDVKADALAALEHCGAPVKSLQVTTDAPAWYHPGRSGALRMGKQALAYFGEIHPTVSRKLGLKGRVVAFEIFMDNIPEPKKKGGKTRSLLNASSFQSVNRDFAFTVKDDVTAEKILRAAQGADKKLISAVNIFDVYKGEDMGDEKSVAISVTLQPTDKTLTDDDIEAVSQKVIAMVAKATGGSLRG